MCESPVKEGDTGDGKKWGSKKKKKWSDKGEEEELGGSSRGQREN